MSGSVHAPSFLPSLPDLPATRLLYYEDAYVKIFDAQILFVTRVDGKTVIVLDRTAFYPTGGGQPCDTGVVKCEGGMAKVVDVQMRRGVVLHFAEETVGAVREGAAGGVVNWSRRYALMRNHTASHLLAAVVRRAVGKPLEIVGSGIDVDKARLDFAFDGSLRDYFQRIEEISDTAVKADRPVSVKTMARDVAEKYVAEYGESLKTLPPQVQQVRVVEVEGWHACACGGIHVKSTGELGEIRLLGRVSKGRGVERLEFAARNP